MMRSLTRAASPIDVFQVKIDAVRISAGYDPSFRRLAGEVEEPAVVVAQDTVIPIICAHVETETAVEGSARLDIVAWDDLDVAVVRLFRLAGIPVKSRL